MTGITQQIANSSGTWTPVDASGASISLTADGGYTRLGNMVIAQFRITYPATASGATASIGGLPFTVSNIPTITAGYLGTQSTTGVALVGVFSASGGTTMSFTKAAGALATNIEMTTATVSGAIIYRVA